MRIWAAAAGLAGVVVSAGAQTPDWCERVRAMTQDPAVAAAHWGVQVTALDGTVLCAVNAGQLFRPASNNKLLTLAAGLALLGPERRFTTAVVVDGTIADGVLSGRLRLVGGGDANFGSRDVPYVEPAERSKGRVAEPATIADVEALADQIVAKGIKQVNGDVVGDDSYFAGDPYPQGWGVDDLVAGFGAPVSALTIHDNEVELQMAPAAVKAGDEVQISFAPDVAYYGSENLAVTGPVSAEKPVRGHLRLERPVGGMTIRVAGEMPLNAAAIHYELAIQEPAAFAAQALKEALARRGVKVTGEAQARHAFPEQLPAVDEAALGTAVKAWLARPGGAFESAGVCKGAAVSPQPGAVLVKHESPRLAEDVRYTLKESQNLHAEVMLRNLGAAWLPCGPHSADAGLAVVRAFLGQVGVGAKDFVLYDGSGLSARDLLTPRAMTTLLVYAAKQTWFGEFKAALPVGGVDGTLENRFKAPDSTLTGKVLAKTGTLGESRDLAGYVTGASGKMVVFSVMVDNHLPRGNADQGVMDRMVEAIAGAN